MSRQVVLPRAILITCWLAACRSTSSPEAISATAAGSGCSIVIQRRAPPTRRAARRAGSDQPHDIGAVGEGADDVGAPWDLGPGVGDRRSLHRRRRVVGLREHDRGHRQRHQQRQDDADGGRAGAVRAAGPTASERGLHERHGEYITSPRAARAARTSCNDSRDRLFGFTIGECPSPPVTRTPDRSALCVMCISVQISCKRALLNPVSCILCDEG